LTPSALEIRELRKNFGGLPAADGITTRVPAGDRRLLLGPNGAGKTTLFNLVTGEIKPTSGSIKLFDEEIAGLTPERCARRGIGRTYQIITLFPHHSVRDNVVFAQLGKSARKWNPFAPLRRRGEVSEHAMAVLERVGLAEAAERPLQQTSYGEKRRLEIALALAQEPKVLMLDEPLAGLSREERRGVCELLGRIPREITVVLIEHDLDAALPLAETITVMNQGRVVVEGPRAEVVRDPRVREVYLAG
jgi:branched-chain amino acid transport system ATP-binding protein